MPSSDPLQRFEDILANIVRIEEHTSGIDSQAAFESNRLVHDATERCLQRISEAAKKLGSDAEEICPSIPWPRIRGLGNLLRREYDNVELFRIWFLIKDDLPQLKAAVESALTHLKPTENV